MALDDDSAAVVDGCGDGDGVAGLTECSTMAAVTAGCGDGDGVVVVLTRLAMASLFFGSTDFASPVLKSLAFGSPAFSLGFGSLDLGSVHLESGEAVSASVGRGRGSRPGVGCVAVKFTIVAPNIGAGCGPA
jgi:hypothetical protein